ncbi:hypothetical protein [Microvirga makkahensis]|uniref:Uncharacterized protein n=1 Tax=Microvirga makkahensis TaxID=1128670 RepID=A0A7X3MX59_9HYPH|nr:hypothetical protein [Microvirga makkahensis]MXQ14862.1 hypothetical protein [Microvirga makkahensis]
MVWNQHPRAGQRIVVVDPAEGLLRARLADRGAEVQITPSTARHAASAGRCWTATTGFSSFGWGGNG